MTNETEIFDSALSLPTERRKALVHLLLDSLPDDDARSIDEAWETEIARRLHDYAAGITQAIQTEEVFGKYRKPAP